MLALDGEDGAAQAVLILVEGHASAGVYSTFMAGQDWAAHLDRCVCLQQHGSPPARARQRPDACRLLLACNSFCQIARRRWTVRNCSLLRLFRFNVLVHRHSAHDSLPAMLLLYKLSFADSLEHKP